MGSVLGVAVFGSITASVFAGRMGSSVGSLGAAAAAGHRPAGFGAARGGRRVRVRRRPAVLAGAIVVAAGLVVAFRAFRPVRVAAEAADRGRC